MILKKGTIINTLQKTAAIITLLLIIIISSCENGTDCNINNVSYNRIQLYGAEIQEDAVSEKYIYPDTLTVKLIINGNDSIIINRIVGASELQLPVSYTHECDTLVFEYSGNLVDTLYMEHSNIPFFISTDCGMAMYHQITGLRHTNNMIDSAAINESFIDFDWHENIKLYLFE